MPKEFIEKLPPQNIEAEQSVLGSLLIDKDAIIKVADIIKPEDFYKDIHKFIFEAMLEIYEQKEPIDVLSLANRLEEKNQLEIIGGRTYLANLTNSVPTASNVVFYAQIVQKKATLRKLIHSASDIIELAYQETDELNELLDRSEQKIFSVSQRYLKQAFIPIKEVLAETFDRIDELHKHSGKLRGISTGFTDLDNKLAGLQKSDLIVLAARPSMGKSSLALDIARKIAVKLNIPVGIFSLEMSKESIVDRLLCAESGIDLWKMRTGHLSDKDEEGDFPKIGYAMGVLSEAPIYIDDSATANVMEIRTKARRLQTEHGLGLLIIDYLQLMEGSGRKTNESRVQEVSEISRSLKAIARELDIPVLAVSQLSRAVESRNPPIPKLADLRESGCLNSDTLITNAATGERIPIKKIAEGKIKMPMKVLTIRNDYKLEPRQMIKAFYSGKKMVFELKTRSGRKIKASANHPFFKLEGWKRLDELKVNDSIALPRKIEIENPANPLSREEIILLAHLLGDGCILPRQPFHYTSADKKNIRIVRVSARKLFKIKGKIVKQKNWYHLYLPSPYHLTHKTHHPITNWFKKLNIKLVHSWEKEIPEYIFQSSKENISLFLKHLWATDGNLSWKNMKKRKPAGAIYYASSSEKMASQVQDLLLRLGIQSSLKEIKDSRKESYQTMYHIHIQGAENQLKFLEIVGIGGEREKIVPQIIMALKKIVPNPNTDIIPKESWQLIIEPIKEKMGISWRTFSEGINTNYCGATLFKSGLSRERMLRVSQVLKNPLISDLAKSDIYWDKIVSIKPLGIKNVYDVTVEGNHNFVANDIIVHNSIEQDADVVLCIYREEMYKRNTEKKHIADIYIAKHRNGPTGIIQLYFDERLASFKNLEKTGEEIITEEMPI